MGKLLTAAGAACVWLVACSGDGGAGGAGGSGAGSGSGGSSNGGSANGGTSGSGGVNILTESCGDWVPTSDAFFSVADISSGQDLLFVAGSYVGVEELGVGSGGGQGPSDVTGYVVALAQSDLTPKWRFDLFDAGLESRVFSVAALPGGDVLAVGGQREDAVGASVVLVRLSAADGSEVWRKTFDSPYGNAFVPVQVRHYAASAYLFSRLTKFDEVALPSSNDPWVAQLSVDGNLGWAASLTKPDVGLDRMELVPTPDGDLALVLSADDGTGFQRRTSSITSLSSVDGGVNWTTTLDSVDLRRALTFGGNLVVSAETDSSNVDLGSGNFSSFNGCPLIAYSPISGSYVWHTDLPGVSKLATDSDLDLLAAAGDFAYACSRGLTCGRYDQLGNVAPFPLFDHLAPKSLTNGNQLVSGSAHRLYVSLTFRERGRGVACVALR